MKQKKPKTSPKAPAVEKVLRDNEADDNPTPPAGPIVVGIGASSGGLNALKAFFSQVPPDSGLAFAVVMHLSPDHMSHLATALQPDTKLPVQAISQTVSLQPNRVYVIPPGRNLSASETHLRLSGLEERRADRAPIDRFFETLGETHRCRAIAVILSGNGSDGAIGIKRIKENGGLTIVQDPKEAEFDGMPQSAIATGMVDVTLPVADIPKRILKFVRTQPRVLLRPGRSDVEDEQRRILQRVFVHIHTQTGRDFSHYKRSTLLRRIGRRMQLHNIEDLDQYVGLLRDDPNEVRALSDDFLINVTVFFRDEGAFQLLQEQVIPELFKGRGPCDKIRVWSIGCATGEEAYSLAILLVEEAERYQKPPKIQIFASDLHDPSLQRARDGYFTDTIVASVSPERLNRFFIKENGGYRVRREVRDLIIFANHNILSDPPFSRIDLVSCRNLLIYLQREAQRGVVEMLHYALRSGGHLILGNSETVDKSERFRLVDKKHCLYAKRDLPLRELRLPTFTTSATAVADRSQSHHAHLRETVSYHELHQLLLEQLAPPSLLLNADDNIVHLSPNAGGYLSHPGGSLTSNILKLVREELRIELRSAVHAAREKRSPAVSKPVIINDGNGPREVVISVRPAPDPERDDFLLVIFDERQPSRHEISEAADAEDVTLRELQAELDLTRQRLQTIIEEYETSQEEMKASNEELQSSNEELRSTLEELETSNQELQSMNEELTTVSQESGHKVEELTQLSNDLQNLFSATDIATIFLDRRLRILRFTPTVGELFNIRAADRGRPLSDLTHHLDYVKLSADAQRVLDRLAPIEREVVSDQGRWYLSRIIPYRSADERIDGIVMTFIDITERKQAEQALGESEEKCRALITRIEDYAIFSIDENGNVTSWNQGCESVLGYGEREFMGMDIAELFAPEDRAAGVPQGELRQAAEQGHSDNTRWLLAKGGRRFYATGVTTSISDPSGRLIGFSMLMRDQTDWRLAQDALQNELAQRKLLQDISVRLIPEGDIDRLFEEILSASIALTEADMGNIQLRDNESGDLVIAVQHGFDRSFLEFFGRVHERTCSSCAIALAKGSRVIIPDIEKSDIFAVKAVRDAVLETGARAVQSTPLISRSGEVLGVITTYWRRPHEPCEYDLTLLDLLVRQATDLIERHRAEREQRELSLSLERRVTERTAKLAEQTECLRRLAAELSSAEQRERKRLAALLHDDLQQLLMAARMQLSRTASKLGDSSAAGSIRKAEGWIAEAVEAARDLTRQLRPPGLYEDGVGSALKFLVSDMLKRHQLQIKLELHDLPGKLDDLVGGLLFDSARECLFNVVKHSATQKAGVELKCGKRQIRLVVSDVGAGFSIDEAKKTLRNGGIGLFAIRERVAAIGGSMTIESAPGKGTRVEIAIPLDRALAPAGPEPSPLPSLQPVRPVSKERAALTTDPRIRVLLVDDHAMVRHGIASLLDADHRTAVAGECADGIEAIEAIDREHPDVVLMDINMPRMNGIDATREIHRRWPDVIVIGLSIQDDEACVQAMREAGAAAFIPKTGDSENLIATILEFSPPASG